MIFLACKIIHPSFPVAHEHCSKAENGQTGYPHKYVFRDYFTQCHDILSFSSHQFLADAEHPPTHRSRFGALTVLPFLPLSFLLFRIYSLSILPVKRQKHFVSSSIQRSLKIRMSLLKGKRHGNLDARQEERIEGTFNRVKKKKRGKRKN